MITKDCLILWFKDYWTDDLIATTCHDYDLKRGYVELKFYDPHIKTNYSAGTRQIHECVDISKLTTLESPHVANALKWEDRNKLFEKYPELKQRCA